MLVVSDSSPLNFIIRLRCEHVLPTLFQRVLIPPMVRDELSRHSTPQAVRDFVANPPPWLEVRTPTAIENIPKLDPGEVAAISLAQETHADAVLIDDGDGRKAAAQRGLTPIGLLGILERAGERKLIDFEKVAAALPADYRIDPEHVKAALERHRQRQQGEAERDRAESQLAQERIERERARQRDKDDKGYER